jgi:hypothetical protein
VCSVYSATADCTAESDPTQIVWVSETEMALADDELFSSSSYTCKAINDPVVDDRAGGGARMELYVTLSKTSSSPSGGSSSCFASSETVQLFKNGVLIQVQINRVRVGDVVLASDRSGNVKYSTVTAVPHDPYNLIPSVFTQLVTASGRDIKLTADHLITVSMSCSDVEQLALLAAGNVKPGMCLVSLTGLDPIVELIASIVGNGVHTIVADEEFIVVNGFLSSPFAHNHSVGTAYYALLRVVRSLLPTWVSASSILKQANEILGTLVMALTF